jgi:hypothetical protein
VLWQGQGGCSDGQSGSSYESGSEKVTWVSKFAVKLVASNVATAHFRGLRETDSRDRHLRSDCSAGRTKTEKLRPHPEWQVARQGSAGCDHHRTGGGPCGNRSL